MVINQYNPLSNTWLCDFIFSDLIPVCRFLTPVAQMLNCGLWGQRSKTVMCNNHGVIMVHQVLQIGPLLNYRFFFFFFNNCTTELLILLSVWMVHFSLVPLFWMWIDVIKNNSAPLKIDVMEHIITVCVKTWTLNQPHILLSQVSNSVFTSLLMQF